jgi:hypothetical protein
MPRLATIAGCGEMVCSTYEEMAAIVDRVYAVAEDEPLSLGEAFATLARHAGREPPRPPERAAGLPVPG